MGSVIRPVWPLNCPRAGQCSGPWPLFWALRAGRRDAECPITCGSFMHVVLTGRAGRRPGLHGARRCAAWGRAWGFTVGSVVHRCRPVVEADCPQGVNGLWATTRPGWFRCWSAAFPRRGQLVAEVGGGLGKNGGHGNRRPYPGCAHRLSTGCGFPASPSGREDAVGDGVHDGARTVERLAVLGISLWTRPSRAPVGRGEGGVCGWCPQAVDRGPWRVTGSAVREVLNVLANLRPVSASVCGRWRVPDGLCRRQRDEGGGRSPLVCTWTTRSG